MTSKLFEKRIFRGPLHLSRNTNRTPSPSDELTFVPLGRLDVEVMGAQCLAAADFGGKSDPYVVLEMDGQTKWTETVYHTLNPRWNEDKKKFSIADISSILHVTVYDEDRIGEHEFLGKVALPVVRFENNATIRKVVALRDKNLHQAAKGTIELCVTLKWDPLLVAMHTITQHTRPEESPVFKASIFVRNVHRVRAILTDMMSAAKYIQSCFEWTDTERSVKAFILFVFVTYNFELYMLPLAIIGYIFIWPAYKKSYESGEAVPDASKILNDDLAEMEGEDENDASMDSQIESSVDDAEDGMTIGARLRAIQSVSVFVQNSLGFVASTIESMWTLLEFRVPFMSWLFVAFLFVTSIILYLIPFRWIVMIWGVNKFSKKLRNPNHVPCSELMNFLSRVPDGPTLNKCFHDVQPRKDEKVNSEATLKKLSSRKASFFQMKFTKKTTEKTMEKIIEKNAEH